MKKLFVIVIGFLGIVSANAQEWYVGPQASLNVCSISKIPNSKAYPGFAIGAFGGYEINDKIGIEAQLTVSTQGVKTSTDVDGVSLSANLKNTYINLPIMAKFNIYQGIYGLAGIQTGMRIGSKLICEGLKISAGDAYKAMDFGLIFGAGYQFDWGLRAGISYNIGLTKVAIDNGGKNRVFAITVGWRF